MATRILHSVARMDRLVERVAGSSELHNLIAQFAHASLYGAKQGQDMARLTTRIMRLTERKFLPLAKRAGAEAADNIARGISEGFRVVAPKRGAPLQRRALAEFRRGNQVTMANLQDGLRAGGLKLRAETIDALRRARTTRETTRAVMNRLAGADREAMASWSKYAKQSREATTAQARATDDMANGLDRKAEYDAAVKAEKSARRNMLARRSFLARFENATHREIVDSMRHEAKVALNSRFTEMGYGPKSPFTWITVSGEGTCPDCSPMHGITKTRENWAGVGPQAGWTICGMSCKCDLVPEAYSINNESLSGPLKAPPRSVRDRTAGEPAGRHTALPSAEAVARKKREA